MERVKNKSGGRPTANDPMNRRCSVNFNSVEYAKFLTMYEQSGVRSPSDFIKARIFNKEFKVIKVDRTLLDYYQKLSALYAQFRGVANNYNQLVVAMKSNFAERKALAFLYRLERVTLEMTNLYRQIITLTEEFKREWSQRSQ
ncbi:MAG: conjugal transfer protein MobA [Rikenellaceae bacterium]